VTDQPFRDPNSVKKVVNVEAAPEIAWRVFTEKTGTWWPLAEIAALLNRFLRSLL